MAFNLFKLLFVSLFLIKVCFNQQTWNIDPEMRRSGGGEDKKDPGFDVYRFGCDGKVPINTVRDIEMTDDNYLRLSIRHPNHLLYVTSDWCDYCCMHERELNNLKPLLKDRLIDGENVPLIQIQSNIHKTAMKKLGLVLWKVPTLYFIRNGIPYQYGSFFYPNNILRWMNSIVNPIVELKTVEEVELFFNTNLNYQEKNEFYGNHILDIHPETDYTFKNRLIGFFSDVEEYSSEYSKFVENANAIAYRNDLRVGLVRDIELIRHFKILYEGIWFNSHSMNTIVIKRADKTMFLDISLMNEMLDNFMIYNTIPLVEELNTNNNKIISRITTPLAVFFIDTIFHLENYRLHLKILEEIAKKYLGYYVFLTIDGNVRTGHKEKLGFTKESRFPNLVLNYVKTGKQKEYPNNVPYVAEEVIKFLDENINKGKNDLEELKQKQMKSFDEKIVKMVSKTTKLNKSNFDSIILNKKYDAVLLVLDTDYEHKSEEVAKYYERVVERIKTLGFKSLIMTSYDINENGLLNFRNLSMEKGTIYMLPANSKQLLVYNDKVTVLRVLKWIEKNADNKLRLPDIPHIELELQDEYYKKKAVLEAYEENINKDDLEIDDLINMDFQKRVTDTKDKYEL